MFFAYIGFDAVSTAAQEAKNPSRDMPIGILSSLAICTVIYIAVAIVLLGIVPYQQLNVADPLAVGIDATGLRWLSPVIKIAALFGLFSTMLVNLLAQTRIFYSMSRDGLLPQGLCDGPPEVPHAAREHHHDRGDHRAGRGADAYRRPRTAREHRHAARVRAGQHRHHHPAQDAAGRAAAIPHARASRTCP
jgi:hypothetical protein